MTGGLASGKSTVARLFGEHGMHVLSADMLAHELMMPGGVVYEEVVRVFGRDILAGGEGSAFDRAKLAAKAFDAHVPRIAELNAIVHPAVLREQERWMEEIADADPQGIAVVEAALLYEAGAESQFDKTVVVVAPEELRIERYAARVTGDHGEELQAARADAARRIAVQMPDAEKRRRADLVIENSGSLAELAAAAEKVTLELRGWL
ncbi:MAG: dephospho-CoA kinase [Acidobacteriaceae bacterium]